MTLIGVTGWQQMEMAFRTMRDSVGSSPSTEFRSIGV
jgi:hypothetical protein